MNNIPAIADRTSRRFRPSMAKPLSAVRPRYRMMPSIAPATGPFDRFTACENVLVIADIENWAYGARDLGLEIDFAALSRLLKAKLKHAALHAFFSAPAGDTFVTDRLAAFGWEPHPRVIIERSAHFGISRSANADLAIAFGAAKLLGHQRADVVLLGTGDGVLALDCARAIRANFKRCGSIGTISLAGSTSRLLDARVSREITANVEIGMDAMRPLVR